MRRDLREDIRIIIEMWKKMFYRWLIIKESEKMSRDSDNEDFMIRFSFVLCVLDWFR